jgi:hypothetical protein
MRTLLAIQWAEFGFLPPVCLAIALVTAATHHAEWRPILRHAIRSFAALTGGILAFMVAISYLFEWLLPK